MSELWKLDEGALIDVLEKPMRDLRDVSRFDDKQIKTDLPENSRQILTVKTYSMISATSRDSLQNPVVTCQPHIAVYGHPAPSSDVERGYIRFVDANALRTPSYSAKDKLINLYLDYRAMPQVLEQLQHAQRYLWVGHFAHGHIYGDLHSAP